MKMLKYKNSIVIGKTTRKDLCGSGGTMIKYILLFCGIMIINEFIYSQTIDTTIVNSLKGVFLRDDCPAYNLFSITCSGYYLENGKYKCFFSSDVTSECWEGTYKIRKNKIIFRASKFRTKRYKLIKNNKNIEFVNKKDLFIYHKTEYSKERFMKSWNSRIQIKKIE